MDSIKLSLVIPILNELNHIDNLIHSINKDDKIEKEIFLVDGGSTDGTIEKIKEIEKLNNNIYYLNNSSKHVSSAFNIAYKKSKGEYIGLIGAHSIYSDNYFSDSIIKLDNNECDATGGLLLQKGRNLKSKAIAKCMSSKFGVGNTSVRTINTEKIVESAAFCIYKKKIFKDIGLFDEELVKNQDDEFHYRLNSAGYKILLNPNIYSIYYVRSDFQKLFSQYYLYGYYKPLVLKKVPSGFSFRHIIPMFFLIYLLTLPLIYFSFYWIFPFILYLILGFILSLNSNLGIKGLFYSMIAYFCLHLSYGLGFLIMIIKLFLKLK